MRKIILTLLLLGVYPVHTPAGVWNDGEIHTIDYLIDDSVWIEDSPAGDFTTLNLVDDGIIELWVSIFPVVQFGMIYLLTIIAKLPFLMVQ